MIKLTLKNGDSIWLMACNISKIERSGETGSKVTLMERHDERKHVTAVTEDSPEQIAEMINDLSNDMLS
jgi:uncharacterized protein YlzI (FlbEa/FlbD family)